MNASPSAERFDPLHILAALERRRVAYVVIGELARVVHGTDEIADRVEICPQLRPANLDRLEAALHDLGALTIDGAIRGLDRVASRYSSAAGEVAITPSPAGTAGFDDLRRKATREPLGMGVRAAIADPADLARMASATGRPIDRTPIAVLRRVAELTHVRDPI